jgi:hypothetical protein
MHQFSMSVQNVFNDKTFSGTFLDICDHLGQQTLGNQQRPQICSQMRILCMCTYKGAVIVITYTGQYGSDTCFSKIHE